MVYGLCPLVIHVFDKNEIDKNLKEQEKKVDKLADDINNIVKIVKSKGKDAIKVFIYVIPKEIEIYKNGKEKIEKKTNLKVEIFANNDKNKYDPENKSSRAAFGKPALFLE